MANQIAERVEILLLRADATVERLGMERLDDLDQLLGEPGTLAWVHVAAPSNELVAELQREFALHPAWGRIRPPARRLHRCAA